MKKINKLASIIVLSGLAFGAFANDDASSPFACQNSAQVAKMQAVMSDPASNGLPPPFTCDAHQQAWIQLGGSGNLAQCEGASSKKQIATHYACEVNPQYWRGQTQSRHVCDPSVDKSLCAVEVY